MRHTIQKQIFDLWVHPHLDALALQQRVSERSAIDIIPELEKRFHAVSDEDNTIIIESLEVDLGLITEDMIDTGQWAVLFREKLEEALQECLNDITINRGGTIISREENAFSQWCYFITHGYLPWNAAKPSAEWLQQVLESLAGNYKSAAALSDLLRNNTAAAERIVLQHSPGFLSHLVELLTAEKQDRLPASIQELAGWLDAIYAKHAAAIGITPEVAERKIWQAILQKSAAREPAQHTEAFLRFLLTHWLRLAPAMLRALVNRQPAAKKYPLIGPVIDSIIKDALKNEPGTTTQQQKTPGRSIQPQSMENTQPPLAKEEKQPGHEQEINLHEPVEQVLREVADTLNKTKATGEALTAKEQAAAIAEGIYVTQAGLVLLHPFLHSLFRKLELVKDGQFENEAKQGRAICLLYELAETGVPVQEYKLVLAKLLCGWPLHKPVDTGIVLTAAEKKEAQHLLKAVIEQWEILKNTSPVALQETFLQREGKLFYKNEKWYLQVEKRSVDVLLSRLPWMISMIKLPWMKELLMTEWI